MGWTFQYGKPHDPDQRVREMYTQENDLCTQEVVKMEKYGNYYIMALKQSPKPGKTLNGWGGMEPEFDGTITSACILQTKIYEGDWGYKDYGESSGVGSYATAKLISMLTPTTNEHAQEWRNACLENVAKRTEKRKKSSELSGGKKIRLNTPITFTDGQERRDFVIGQRLVNRRNRMFFTCLETGSVCRISRFSNKDYQEIDDTFSAYDRAGYQERKEWSVMHSWHKAYERLRSEGDNEKGEKLREMLVDAAKSQAAQILVDAGLAEIKDNMLIPFSEEAVKAAPILDLGEDEPSL